METSLVAASSAIDHPCPSRLAILTARYAEVCGWRCKLNHRPGVYLSDGSRHRIERDNTSHVGGSDPFRR